MSLGSFESPSQCEYGYSNTKQMNIKQGTNLCYIISCYQEKYLATVNPEMHMAL
jgi:hypothetical protein